MCKNILIISLVVLGGMFLANLALAAVTISFSPVDVNVVQGESFDLVIAVNPQGITSYTTKAELEYPSDLLEIKSFSFGSGWMVVSQPGYDLVDNTNGILIKTAGYPGGLSSAVTFGTISFSAKKSGSGVVGLKDGSMILDAANQDVLSSSLIQAVVSITAPEPTPITPAPSVEAPKVETPALLEEIEAVEEVETLETEDDDIEEPAEQTIVSIEEEDIKDGFLAGIAGLGSNLGGWLIITGIILLLAAVLIIIRKKR